MGCWGFRSGYVPEHVLNPGQAGIEAQQGGLGFGQGRVREIQGAAVVAVDEEETHHLRRKAGQNLLHREEISQGLGHLLGVDGEEAVVQPKAGERVSRWPPPTGPVRFRGGERPGPGRRRAGRRSPPGTACSWRSTRCASPAARGPRGCPRPVPRAWMPSTGRNPGDPLCWGPPRSGPRPPCPPVFVPRACRIPGSGAPGRRRRRPCRP